MPKVKTKSGAKKRFKVTGSGKISCRHVGMRHNTGKKSNKQKRKLSMKMMLSPAHNKRIPRMLGK